MASLWQKTLYYLGLVDEAEVDGGDFAIEPQGQEERQSPPAYARTSGRNVIGSTRTNIPGERVEPPSGRRRRLSSDSSLAEAGVYMGDHGEPPMSTSGGLESEIIVAGTFSDAQRLADLLRDRVPVVLDLRSTEPEMVRRLVDFASGLVYALDGTMRKVAQGVILVSPARVTVSRDERRRLADLGLYEAADVG